LECHRRNFWILKLENLFSRGFWALFYKFPGHGPISWFSPGFPGRTLISWFSRVSWSSMNPAKHSIHANTRRNNLELALDRAARHSELPQKTGSGCTEIRPNVAQIWSNIRFSEKIHCERSLHLIPHIATNYIIFLSINKKVSQILVLILSKKSSSLTLTYW